MQESQIDAQMDRETAIADREQAARRYAAALLAISVGEGDQEQLRATRQRLVEMASAHATGRPARTADRAGDTDIPTALAD
jgi:hypothetical protein